MSGMSPMMGHHSFPPMRSPHPHMSPHMSPHHGVMPPGGPMGMGMSPHHQQHHMMGFVGQQQQHPQQQVMHPHMSPHGPLGHQGVIQQHQPQQPPALQQQQLQQQQQNNAADRDATQVSSLPLPPMQYVEKYTDLAVAKNTIPPPPPPILDSYSMFGNPFSNDDSIIQSLETQGIRRLYSSKDVDRKKELNKLNQSVLVNFLDLLDILIRAPESPKREEKIEDINLLFIHMHHLINEFRPHQARETLRVMLQMQMRKRMQVAERFQKNLDLVQETIENALRSLPEQEDQESKFSIAKDCAEAMMSAWTKDESETETCASVDRLMSSLADETAIDET